MNVLFLRIVVSGSTIPTLVTLDVRDTVISSVARAGKPFPSWSSTTIIAFVPFLAKTLFGKMYAVSLFGAPLIPTVLTVMVLLASPLAEAVMLVEPVLKVDLKVANVDDCPALSSNVDSV